VERAQLLYEALAAKVRGTETSVMLLHARFTSKHRAEKEQTIRAEFGSKKKNWSNPSLILVATQVIEVGLDITCENLHTEIAPASAVLQRAGRCARFKDERGDVFIYDVPLDKNGNRSFAPYGGKVERYLCEKAWDVFRKRLAQSLDFYGEQEVIDEVHTETDTRMLDELEESKGQTWDQIRHAITQCDPSMRPQLIRDASDTCTLLVCDDPESLGNPYGYRGFSFHRGSLLGKWNDLREWARARELEWVIRYPSEIAESQQSEDAKQALEFEWPAVPLHMELRNYMYPIYLVNPALVAYDEGTGFRFSESGGVVSDDLLERAKGPKHGFDSKYRLEGYPGHVQKMIRLHREGQAARLIYAATQLEKRLGLPSCGVDRATRLAIAFHDVGKMQVDWQMWARNYEAAIGERDQVSDPNVMIAHTHSETEEHRQKERKVRPKRPHHAAEGAVATKNLAKMLVGETGALYKAVVTAIARHHSPHTDSFDERYRMHSAAPLAVVLALKEVGENVDAAIVAREFELTAPDINFDEEVLGNDDPAESWLIYLLVVRALRLADGESLGGDVV
jgi:CRISPR-associated endonuclease/helicase Cas3